MSKHQLKVGESVVFTARDGATYSAKISAVTRGHVTLSIPSMRQSIQLDKPTAARSCTPFGDALFLVTPEAKSIFRAQRNADMGDAVRQHLGISPGK